MRVCVCSYVCVWKERESEREAVMHKFEYRCWELSKFACHVCATMWCQEGVVNTRAIKSHKNKKFHFSEIGSTHTVTHIHKHAHARTHAHTHTLQIFLRVYRWFGQTCKAWHDDFEYGLCYYYWIKNCSAKEFITAQVFYWPQKEASCEV